MIRSLNPVPENFAVAAQVKCGDYDRMYAQSVEDPERFCGPNGRRIDWITEFSRVRDSNFAEDDCHIRWFYDGNLNVGLDPTVVSPGAIWGRDPEAAVPQLEMQPKRNAIVASVPRAERTA
jgi:hypothetical protein